MKTKWEAKTLWCLIGGFIVQIAPIIYAAKAGGHPISELAQTLVTVGRIVGMGAFMAGVGFLAQSKGRSGFLGALGLFSIVGLGIVMALPSVSTEEKKTA